MIRAKLFQGDPSLAFVEASTQDELHRATSTPVCMCQEDPEFPFGAIVPADAVRDLLAAQSSTDGTP
jgi:hypothetical protein